jgi:hypothetical protein
VLELQTNIFVQLHNSYVNGIKVGPQNLSNLSQHENVALLTLHTYIHAGHVKNARRPNAAIVVENFCSIFSRHFCFFKSYVEEIGITQSKLLLPSNLWIRRCIHTQTAYIMYAIKKKIPAKYKQNVLTCY